MFKPTGNILSLNINLLRDCPVSWGCRIHWLQDPPPNECLGYDIKQSDGEVPVMLELWGI